MKRLSILLSLLALGFSGTVSAQGGMNWPEDKQTAMEKYTIFSDNVKQKRFKEAREPFKWLLTNAPNLHKNLYIHGINAYEAIADGAVAGIDAKQQAGAQDTVLMLYDMRLKHNFGAEGDVLNRKGLKAWNYLKDRPGTTDQLYDLYQKIFELNGTNVYAPNALAYMDVLCKKKAAGAVDDEKVLNEYGRIEQAHAANVTKGGQTTEAWNLVKTEVDRILASCVTIDCNFVRNQMAPQFQQNPDDLALAKKIASLMITGKCTDDPLFMDVAKVLLEKEPSYGWAITIARKERNDKNFDSAINYYNRAAELAEDNQKKAETIMEIATLQASRGQREASRASARRALSADPNYRDAYRLIGDLYMNSYKDCGGDNPIDSRLVFIAAYDMYEKAGATAQMKTARAQFPSKTDVFTYGKQEGATVNTGCWVNESVTLKVRPE
jgi:tetratricopeptide (TPR) repeat protein